MYPVELNAANTQTPSENHTKPEAMLSSQPVMTDKNICLDCSQAQARFSLYNI